ncbi:hypothetical protein ACIRPP_03015 [Streptomyces sp. NPDC101219]|uniref:hypothetical protein n=1 Tax=Streptomyces sp. NPDC101219 TaxID=3366131 RepID=UPI003809F555
MAAGASVSRPVARPPAGPRAAARPVRVLATVLAAGTLLATAACSGGGGEAGAASGTASTVAERPPAAQTTASPSPGQELTETGARNALITESDLEDDWNLVKDPATWRDSLLLGDVDAAKFLTGKSDAQDCKRLMDSLYDETLLGSPSGASAVTGFEQGDSRLYYQVAAYEKADLDQSMEWLKSLPSACDEFTLTGGDHGDRTVQVVERTLPEEGEARQGLTVTVKGTSDGDPVTLTLDVAAVQVGANAITVTNGGLDGADHDSTDAAVAQGTPRLTEVLAGGTPQPTPSGAG